MRLKNDKIFVLIEKVRIRLMLLFIFWSLHKKIKNKKIIGRKPKNILQWEKRKVQNQMFND